MSDIEKKALEMISAARKEHPTPDNYLIARTALCRAIEQHEAFRQEVSDAVENLLEDYPSTTLRRYLNPFITPAVEPDPLVAALEGVTFDHYPPNDAKTIRAALDAAGFEIREKNDG